MDCTCVVLVSLANNTTDSSFTFVAPLANSRWSWYFAAYTILVGDICFHSMEHMGLCTLRTMKVQSLDFQGKCFNFLAFWNDGE